MSFENPVVLVGSGEINWEIFEQIRRHDYPIVAVDSGADELRQAGVQPHAIIGDLDSLFDRGSWSRDVTVAEIAEQETTDFEKALYATQAPLYLSFGFLGKRLDHTLAALHCISKYRSQKSVILIDMLDILLIPGEGLDIELPLGCRISVFPVAPVTFRKSQGLAYKLDDLTLSPGTAIGTSNSVTESRVFIKPAPGNESNYALVVPTTVLPAVLNWYQRKGK